MVHRQLKEQLVKKIVFTYKNFLSKCIDFDKLWEASPLFLTSDPKMQFLNFCWRFMIVFDKSGYFKNKRNHYLSTFAEVSELKKFAKTLDDKFVKDNLRKMMENSMLKLQHELTIGEKKNEVTARKPMLHRFKCNEGAAFMQLEHKIQVSQYIRSLMAAPYNVGVFLYPTS